MVTKHVSPVDYELQLNKKVKKPFHINMLKEWIDRNIIDQAVSGNDVEVSNLTCHEESEQYSCCGVVLDCESDDKLETYIENPQLGSYSDVLIDVP